MKTSVVAPAVIACLMSIILTQAGPLPTSSDLVSRDAADYDIDSLYIRDIEEEIAARAMDIEAREPKHSKKKKKHSHKTESQTSQTVATPTSSSGDVQPVPTSPVMSKRYLFDEDESVLEARKKKKSKSKKKKSKKSKKNMDDDDDLIFVRAERGSQGKQRHNKGNKLPKATTPTNPAPLPTATLDNGSSVDAQMQGKGGSSVGKASPRKGRKHRERDLDDEFELEARGKKSKKHKSKKHKSDSDSDSDSSERRDLFDVELD